VSVVRRAVALVAALLVLTGCGAQSSADEDGSPVSNLQVHDSDGLHGVVLPKPYAVPRVRLTDSSGAVYDLATRPRKPLTLVFFGYTHCPDVCQVVMANIASALVRLDADQRASVDMVFVTTDPARDSGRVLRSYLDRFNPAFEGVTGPLPSIVRAGKAFGVTVEKGQKLASGGYDVGHGTQVVGLRPDGTAPFVWTEGTDPGDLAADIDKILAGKVSGL
jgi:protein SCO1/2